MRKNIGRFMVAFTMAAGYAGAEIVLDSEGTGSEGVSFDWSKIGISSTGNAYYNDTSSSADYSVSGVVTESAAFYTEFEFLIDAISVANTTVGANFGAKSTDGLIDRDNNGNIGVRGGAGNGMEALEGLLLGINATNLSSGLSFQLIRVGVAFVGNPETGTIVNRNDASKSMTFGYAGSGADWEGSSGLIDVTDLDIIVQGGTLDGEVASVFGNSFGAGNFRVTSFKLEVIPEPATLGLFGLVAGLSLMVRRFRI